MLTHQELDIEWQKCLPPDISNGCATLNSSRVKAKRWTSADRNVYRAAAKRHCTGGVLGVKTRLISAYFLLIS